LQVKVETQARNMAKVNVGVSWEPKGAKLDFRNQFHDVCASCCPNPCPSWRELAADGVPGDAWSYEMLPNDAPAIRIRMTRPASLSDGNNLDLLDEHPVPS